METKYEEIEFDGGVNIESAIEELKKYTYPVCGLFNGKMLYSDVDDVNSAYVKITGKTKAESDAEQQKWHDEYKRKQKEHEENIPKLTEEWIDKGKLILNEKYIDLWIKCVPIRLSDLYHGMELGACLEIVEQLNAGCELETAREIIEKQGHSGMSFNLVRSMVKSFCDRGNEFADFVK